MEWISLTNEAQLAQLTEESNTKPQVIFKHSTRCSISSVAMQRLRKNALPDNLDFYYLDLIAYRDLSNKIAQQFGVPHESPQILVIRNGACVFDESHLAISTDAVLEGIGA